MITPGAYRWHLGIVRAVAMLLVGMILMSVHRVLDMLRRTPTRLAPEGQEHQAPAIEAGQESRDRARPEGDDAVRASASKSGLQDGVLGMVSGKADTGDADAGDRQGSDEHYPESERD